MLVVETKVLKPVLRVTSGRRVELQRQGACCVPSAENGQKLCNRLTHKTVVFLRYGDSKLILAKSALIFGQLNIEIDMPHKVSLSNHCLLKIL